MYGICKQCGEAFKTPVDFDAHPCMKAAKAALIEEANKGEVRRLAQPAAFESFKIGDRVRLRHDVDRYPHFIAPADGTGVVESISEDVFSVQMDEFIEGAEDWENCVWWMADCEDPREDLVIITPV